MVKQVHQWYVDRHHRWQQQIPLRRTNAIADLAGVIRADAITIAARGTTISVLLIRITLASTLRRRQTASARPKARIGNP